MTFDRKHVQTKRAIRVLLDDRPVQLPARTLQSLAAVRAQLELLALRQDRVLTTFLVDGENVSLPLAAAWSKTFCQVQAQTISFQELGRNMAITARQQLHRLRTRCVAASAWVLINEWPAVERWQQELDEELRTLLVMIGFLRELCDPGPRELDDEGQSLGHHLEKLGLIRRQLAIAHRQRDAWAASDLLIQPMTAWLEQVEIYLARLCPDC